MKNILIVIGLLISVLSLPLQAEWNALYFGPEVFFFSFNSHFKEVQIRSSKSFFGFKIGYEYLHPATIYFGIDFLAAAANKSVHEKFKGERIPQSDSRTAFVDYELRLGYTIAKPLCSTALFLCQGAYVFGSGCKRHHFDEGISYLGGGLHSRFLCSQKCNLGLNIKVFGAIDRKEEWRFFEAKRVKHHGLWGGEVAIPLIWWVGCNQCKGIVLEPYFLKLNFTQLQNVYGVRLLFRSQF